MDSRPWFFISHIDADGYMSMANMYVTIMKSLDSHCTLETDFSNPDLFMNINYPTEFPIDKLPENANVVITDTCFTTSTLNVLLDIIDKSNHVYWIDHHKSSLEILDDIKDVDKLDFLIRMDMSATKLTYLIMDYFKNTIVCNVHNCLINAIKYITTYKLPIDDNAEDIPAPIELIDDYDIWLHKKGVDTWYMHYALEYYGKSIYIEFADDIWYSGPNRRNLKYNTGIIHYSDILEIGKIIYNYKKINKPKNK